MKILVTGAGGFTGRAVVKNLLGHNLSVRAMVRNPGAADDMLALGAEPVLADLTDSSSLQSALQGISHVIHIAALFRQAGLPASEFHHVNVEGTRNLLEASCQAGVRRFIHCSTVGVLGHIKNPPANEQTPYNPGDPYQESKVEGEKLFLEYVRQGRIRGCVIRPAMIYGPHDTRTLKLFKHVANGTFFYVGAGRALVHFVDVRDLAEAFHLALQRDDINGDTFIVGGETSLPLKQLAAIISFILGVREPWLHLPVKPMQLLGSLCEAVCTPLRINPPIFRRRVDFFTKDRSFDCTKARNVLGYRPARTLVEELTDIISSYLESGAIRGRLKPKAPAILREMNGQIKSWDDRASGLYGWSREQALGAVSHSLLSTKFPASLQDINSELQDRGVWEGPLIHLDREGREIEVQSRWKIVLLPSSHNPLILEINHCQKEQPGKTSLTALGSLGFLGSEAVTDTMSYIPWALCT